MSQIGISERAVAPNLLSFILWILNYFLLRSDSKGKKKGTYQICVYIGRRKNTHKPPPKKIQRSTWNLGAPLLRRILNPSLRKRFRIWPVIIVVTWLNACTIWKTNPVKLAAFISHDVYTFNTTFYKGALKPWSNPTQEVDMFQHCAIVSESTDVRHLSLECKLWGIVQPELVA